MFELGFRPFFLLAGLAAVLLVGVWLWLYLGSATAPGLYYGAQLWHGHEMLFGFTLAVVAGFLLTAVRNWTQLPMPRGRALLGLVALWLAGRLLPFAAAWLPAWSIALVDLAFLPVLALVLALPLIRCRQTRNLVFLVILLALAVCNLLVHLDLLGLAPAGLGRQATLQAVYLIVLLITIMGGRVIPFFTEKAIPGMKSRSWPLVEYTGLAALLLFILLKPFLPTAATLCALVASLAHGLRLYGWYHRGIWSRPLLWVLHLGYAWLVAGLLMEALAWFGVPETLALHAMTVGGIGMVTLGMMARVSLGHTGRSLEITSAVVWSFRLLALAVLLRVFMPLAPVAVGYADWVLLAGVAWILAFGLFVRGYGPILSRPRIDGLR